MHPDVARYWLAYCLGSEDESSFDSIEVHPQAHYAVGEGEEISYVDLEIRYRHNGEDSLLFSEHKWRSPTDIQQLQQYYRLLERQAAIEKTLVFIAPSLPQTLVAERAIPNGPRIKTKVLLWADVYTALEQFHELEWVGQLLELMRDNGLSPQPHLTSEMLRPDYSDRQVLQDRCKDLNPILFAAEPSTALERRGATSGWEFRALGIEMNIFVGFLMRQRPHGLDPANPQSAVEILLLLEVHRTVAGGERVPNEAIESAEQRLSALSPAPLVNKPARRATPDWHPLLFVRTALTEVVGHPTLPLQAKAVYKHIESWVRTILQDGQFLRAVQEAFPAPTHNVGPGTVRRRLTPREEA